MDALDSAVKAESSIEESLTYSVLLPKSGISFQKDQWIYPTLVFPPVLPDITKVLTAPLPAVNPRDIQSVAEVPEKAGDLLVDEGVQNGSETPLNEMYNTGFIAAIEVKNVKKTLKRRKSIKRRIKNFFTISSIFVVSILILGLLIFTIMLVRDPFYKVLSALVFLFMFSYLCSIQAKTIYLARWESYLSAMQFINVGQRASKFLKEDDMKHMKLIKQDTSTYLRALKNEELKRVFPQ